MNKDGLPVEALYEHLSQRRLLSEYPDQRFERISNAELLESEVDILIPAALENQITSANAGKVRAAYIVEAANGPISPDGDRILDERGITVVPDILANAGGVVVSYFEWVQNLQEYMWEECDVNCRLERIMTNAFNEVWDLAGEKGVTLRIGAYMSALKRVVGAKKLRGVFP